MVSDIIIKRVFDLSKVSLTEREDLKKALVAGAKEIESIQSIKTDNIENLENIATGVNIFGRDLVSNSFTHKELASYTKNFSDGYFIVPKVF